MEGSFEVAPVETEASAVHARSVTEEECAFYQEHGWVKLPGLISAETAERLQAEAERLASAEATGDLEAKGKAYSAQAHQFQSVVAPSESSDLFRSLSYSRALGLVAARLMSTPLTGPRKARRAFDSILVKLPSDTDASEGTRWHQDRAYFPFDRDGALMMWIALVPMTADMGTLRFVDGSHRLGLFGRHQHIEGGDALQAFPAVAEKYPLAPPLDMRPGDATVHDALTFHSAAANVTDRARWAVAQGYFPADTLYTGQPHGNFDKLGLTINEPLDHPELPIVGEA